MEAFLQIIRQMGAIFRKMTPVQRTNIVLLVGMILLSIVFMVVWAGRPDYVLLYSNLSSKDAGAIKAKLDELKISTQVRGNAIYVPAKKVYEIRLLLANQGLPQGSGVGYEIFDRTNLGMTDYIQRLNYKRALEGELARTINTLSGINQSRVHLVLPKRTLFKDEEDHASASVVLNVEHGATLSRSQIAGIVHLVASSVEGLRAEDVAVIDNRGNLLSGSGDENIPAGLTASQLEVTKNVEAYLERKAESMLTGILGPGKAIVRVNAVLDFNRVEKTEEKFDPDSAVARTETRTEEISKETSPVAVAESPKGQTTSQVKTTQTSTEKTTTRYEINKTIERIVSSVGNIKKISVAVVVDGTYKLVETEGGKKGTMKKEYVPRSEEEKQMYKKLVMNAVGFSAERGDEIEVINAPFDTSYLEEEMVAMRSVARKDFILASARQIGVIILVLIAFILLRSTIKKASLTMATGRTEAVTSVRREEVTPGGRLVEYERTAPREEVDIMTVASQDPEAVAQLVKDWLEE